MPASKKESRTFAEAFTRVLLNRTGISPTDHQLIQEHMDAELLLALRVDGHAGEAHAQTNFGGGPTEDEKNKLWSDDAEELAALVRQLGPRNQNLCSEAFLKPFFRHLCLTELTIKELDDDAVKFSRLTSLDVSRNKLSAIENLPPNLKFLKAYNNPVTRFSCKAVPTLVFLGLGHSRIGAEGLEQAARRFRNLMSLDLSYSEVGDISSTLAPLQPMQKLYHLCLLGSPVCVLPHYRLKILRGLPKLQVFDGLACSEEELADAQLFAEQLQPGPRPRSLTVAIQPQYISGARVLLKAIAEAAPPPPPAEGDEAEGEAPQDAIVKACAGGALRFRFGLPGDKWVETSELLLDGEAAEEKAAAAEAAGEEAEPAFDSFSLLRLKSRADEPLFLDLPLSAGATQDGLQQFCQWLRKGLALKVSFRPAMPKPPEEEEGAGEEAAAAAAEEGAEQLDGPLPEPPEPPQEVPIGGAVVPLAKFLHRDGSDVTEEVRQSGALPELPGPWKQEMPDVRVVPMDHWLDMEVQVPPVPELGQKRVPFECDTATLELNVTLYAGEPPTEEEIEAAEASRTPPPPDPKAAAKGKAKAKAKK